MKRKTIIQILIPIIIYPLVWYILLPAINITNIFFWFYLLATTIVVLTLQYFIEDGYSDLTTPTKLTLILLIIAVVSIVLYFILYLFSSPVFITKARVEKVQEIEKDFTKDFPETNIENTVLFDRDSSYRQAKTELGNLGNISTVYTVSEELNQIILKGQAVRVTPLKYGSIIKNLNNRHKGVPGVIIVNQVTGETDSNILEQPIMYSKSEILGRDIRRHIRFKYPTSMLGEIIFELDDDMNPYYITTIDKKTIGINANKEPVKVLIVNATTGKIKEYEIEDIPEWVDRVYDAELIKRHINWKGKYKNGFINAYLGQEDVVNTSEGYNYIPINGKLYVYVGLQPTNAPETIVGFTLTSTDDKTTYVFRDVAGAEEHSAMESIEGSLQQYEYESTYPQIGRIEEKPLYFITAKDDSGLVKKYGIVEVENFSKIYLGDTMKETLEKYYKENDVELIKESEIEVKSEIEKILDSKEGIIERKEQTIENGQTIYYLIVDKELFRADIKVSNKLPFIDQGTEIGFYYDTGYNIQEIYKYYVEEMELEVNEKEE